MSSMLEKLTRVLIDPQYRFLVLVKAGFYNGMEDEKFLKRKFRAIMGYDLDLENPVTYNEKLQWIKLNDRDPLYTRLVDKYAVREYVRSIVGDRYLIPLIGVWSDPRDIDFDVLPNRFVLKCTHNSGLGMIICKDKTVLDVKSAMHKLRKSLKENYFYSGREWPYKHVPRQIIAEELLGDGTEVPLDYKFFVFSGEIDSVMVCVGRDSGYPKFYFFDMEWNRLYYQPEETECPASVKRPDGFEEMIEIVKRLSGDLRHVRVDLYNIDGKVYFGELTFFSQSGFDVDITRETDILWGRKICL